MRNSLSPNGLTTSHDGASLYGRGFAKLNKVLPSRNHEASTHLSLFYQAMLTTGLMKELHKDQTYTIFVPTDASFLKLPYSLSFLLNSSHHRPQLLTLLRNHIILGRYDLSDFMSHRDKISDIYQSAYVEELFLDNYLVDGRQIMSKDEINGNIIYHIDGLLGDHEALPRFQFMDKNGGYQAIETPRVKGTAMNSFDVTKAYTNAMYQNFYYVLPLHITKTNRSTRYSAVTP